MHFGYLNDSVPPVGSEFSDLIRIRGIGGWMTDETCIGKTLAERKYVVGAPSPVCVSLYGGTRGCGCGGLVMCKEKEMD